MGLQVIEWRDETGMEMVHRWPATGSGEVRLGAQLVVRESQAAVFFRDGKALDVFGPGRHTLTTLNLPILGTLLNLAFGGETPFQAEVYFVNMRTYTNMKWGTTEPVVFRDKNLAMVRLRAHGLYTMRIKDPQLFVNNVVGTQHLYTTDQVQDWLQDFIIARLNDTLGDMTDDILELPKIYAELSAAVKGRLQEDYNRYGLELNDFVIEAITPPEEVMRMIDERAAMEATGEPARFLQYRTAKAIGDMPQAGTQPPGAEGAAGAAGGAAGTAGTAAAAGAGVGAGLAMGAAMAKSVVDALAEGKEGAPGTAQATAAAGFCPNCGHALPAGAKFCPECGAKIAQSKTCPKCGAEGPANAKFCPQCGEKLE